MQQVFKLFFLLGLFWLTGCENITPHPSQNQESNSEPSIDNLKDVHYKIDKNGDTVLAKTYSSLNQNTNRLETKVVNQSITKKTYEKVPSFDKGYKKQLSLQGQKKKSFSLKAGKVKLSVEAIPLNEFVNLVFGSILKVNYTLDDSVKKMKNPITLNMTEAEESTQFFTLAKKILALNGVKVVKENNLFFISKSKIAADSLMHENIYIGYGKKLPKYLKEDQEVAQFVPYNYVKPNDMVSLLYRIGLSKKDVKIYTYLNMQLILGKKSEVSKALELINLIDRPYLKGKLPYLINFENMPVDKFYTKIEQIFALNGIRVTKNISEGGIVMMPIEELNSMYIITPKKEWLDMLLYWKEKLDKPSEISSEPRLYIYHVKNRKADELAVAVNNVLGLSKTTKKTDIHTNKSETGSSKNKKVQIVKHETASNASLIAHMNYVPTVTADLDTNILMLKLAPEHYKILLPFIKNLDKLPLQTLVEVTVAEVDMTDTFSLGFEYAIRNKGLGGSDILNISGGGSGLGVIFTSSKIDATIDAFAEKKLLDIVSKPKLLILNNTTGTLNVGTQVPIITSETSAADITTPGDTPSIIRNVSYRKTGINMGLTPTINSNGILTMNIAISLSEAQLNDTSGIDSPLIVDRELNTVAVINSGDTILIGGLISHNNSKQKGGIPYLKDIPFIGNLFALQSHKVTKTELIILIRPTIIETPKEINTETIRFKTLLRYIDLSTL